MLVSLSRAAALAGFIVVASPAVAEQSSRPAQEITFLLDAVAHSHCQFNRNGSWYQGEQAREHLQKKYQYLDKRNLAATAENFIERAATSSSISGTAYQIRCPGAAPVASAAWFNDQLARYRAQGK
jgi:hypothetical protein